MKKSLQAKLKKYGTMAAATVGGVAVADAQVVYTDVVPDSTFCNDGDVYNLDLNNDNINDFQIRKNSSSGSSFYQFGSNSFWSSSESSQSVRIDALSSNRFMSASGYPAVLSSGATIGSSASSWGSGSSMMGYYYWSWSYSYWMTSTGSGSSYGTSWSYSWSTTSGNWVGEQDKYLGLEFEISGQTHYGWARLDVNSNASCFTIKDYAYETQPGVAITAGDMGSTSISELNLIQDVTVYTANNVLNVKVPAEIVGYNIKLVDVMGRVVVNQKIAKSSSILDVSNQAKGVYIVLIEGEGKAFAEKITIN